MSVALVHHFHTEVGAVQHISPGVQDAALTIKDGLVEVETVQVESHGADAQGSEPDADNGPGSQEEVKAAAVVEGSVLEDQATEVTVGQGHQKFAADPPTEQMPVDKPTAEETKAMSWITHKAVPADHQAATQRTPKQQQSWILCTEA